MLEVSRPRNIRGGCSHARVRRSSSGDIPIPSIRIGRVVTARVRRATPNNMRGIGGIAAVVRGGGGVFTRLAVARLVFLPLFGGEGLLGDVAKGLALLGRRFLVLFLLLLLAWRVVLWWFGHILGAVGAGADAILVCFDWRLGGG